MAKKKRQSLGTAFAFMSEQPPIEDAPPLSGKIPLLEIRPDPNQPRQFLPGKFSPQLLYDLPTEIIQDWKNSGEALDKFQELSKLADSIALHGLINAITIRASEEVETKYMIVTGERRWWAHVLLASESRQIREGNELVDSNEIKANLTVEGASIRAHQLLENLIRSDLGVIEKAKGMWMLRRELSHNNTVGGLASWSEVEKSLGISRRYRTYITNSLELCDEALRLVQEHNLSERVIRPVVAKLRSSSDLQVEAIQRILGYNEEEASVTLLKFAKQVVDELLSDDELSFEDIADAIRREGLLADGTPSFMDDPHRFFSDIAKELNVTAEVIEAVWVRMQFGKTVPTQTFEPEPSEIKDEGENVNRGSHRTLTDESMYDAEPSNENVNYGSHQAFIDKPEIEPSDETEPEPIHERGLYRGVGKCEDCNRTKKLNAYNGYRLCFDCETERRRKGVWLANFDKEPKLGDSEFVIQIRVFPGKFLPGRPTVIYGSSKQTMTSTIANCEFREIRHEFAQILDSIEAEYG